MRFQPGIVSVVVTMMVSILAAPEGFAQSISHLTSKVAMNNPESAGNTR